MAAHQVNITDRAKRYRARKRARENPWPWSRPDARRTTSAHGGIAYHQGKSRKRADEGNAEFLQTLKPKAKAKKSAGASSMPDEATLQAGFKRGLSLADMLKANPAEFGGKYAPIAAEALQKVIDQYGETNVHLRWSNGQASAQEGVGGTVRLTVPKPRTAHNLYTFLHECAHALISGNLADNSSRAEYDAAQWALDVMRSEGVEVPSGLYRQIQVAIARDVKRDLRAHRDVPQDIIDFTARQNPATASAEAFEEFHGFAPSEVITVTKKIHYHKHLAAAGKLTHLDVWGVDETGHKITGFKGAFLAFNETKDQLFVEGGDQSVNLEDFGIRKAHELETLGRLTDIGYQTNKTHLGDEGGEAVYVHKFRSTNENGRHVIVRIARYPDLIYDVRNEQLLFSGGSYEILREGINK
jgi:hypothetical protein